MDLLETSTHLTAITIPNMRKIALMLIPVFAEVSMKIKLFLSANTLPSLYVTSRLADRSTLFPAKTMTISGQL